MFSRQSEVEEIKSEENYEEIAEFSQDPDRTLWWCQKPSNNQFNKEAYEGRKKEYKAKVVLGYVHPYWDKKRSRFLKNHLDIKHLTLMTPDLGDNCRRHWKRLKSNIRMLIMIHSTPDERGFNARSANRRTWMKDLTVKPFFSL